MGKFGKKLSSYILLGAFLSSLINSSAVSATEQSEENSNSSTMYIEKAVNKKKPDEKSLSPATLAAVGASAGALSLGGAALGAHKLGLFGDSAESRSESALEKSDIPGDNTMYMKKVVDEKKPNQSYFVNGNESNDIRYREYSRKYNDGSKAKIRVWSSMIQINHVDRQGIYDSRGMRFESNEKVDALVEKIYELRKKFEECDQNEEDSLKEQISFALDELSDELFKIYVETRKKNDGSEVECSEEETGNDAEKSTKGIGPFLISVGLVAIHAIVVIVCVIYISRKEFGEKREGEVVTAVSLEDSNIGKLND